MYKHILVPTDGSPLASKAVHTAIEFASETGAKVTGYYGIEDMNMHHAGAYLTKDLIEEFDRRAHEAAEAHVSELSNAAKDAGVAYDWIVSKVTRPHEGIIDAARDADILGRAEQALTKREWEDVKTAVPTMDDPLSPGSAEKRYRELRRQIALEA